MDIVAERLLSKYPDRIPVLIRPGNERAPSLHCKPKFLVPYDHTVGQFVAAIRSRCDIERYQSLFIFINNVLPPVASTMGDVYLEHRDTDGYLRVAYTIENTFG